MKFTNVVAYCKGWYKKRPVKAMWMDLAHCLYNDGYAEFTKEDVVDWCLFYIDNCIASEIAEFNPGKFIKSILVNQQMHKVSIEDSIIIAFCSYVSHIPGNKFTEGVKPSYKVLPFSLKEAYIFNGCWHPAEMMAERLSEIDKMFPNFKGQESAQELSWEFCNFELIESSLYCDDFRDIVVLLGTDSLIDCKETIVTGKFLNNLFEPKNKIDNKCLELGIYKNCKFDDYSNYIVRYKEELDYLDLPYYVVKSIKEENEV